MLKNYEKVIHVCRVCEKPLTGANSKYCSWECKIKHGIILRTHTCITCKEVFTTKRGNHKTKGKPTYCSRECFGKSYSCKNNHSWKGIREERFCLTCKSVFVIKKTADKTKLYCNKICKMNRIRIKLMRTEECGFCKILFTKPKAVRGFKYCGIECSNKAHSIKMRNKNNPNYLHGKANNGYPVEWNKSFKKLIRDRDDFICQLCYMTEEQHGKKLCVHHIDFDRFNLDPENLITLCKYCHGKLHGRNTREKCKEELLNLLRKRNKFLTMCIT